MDLNDSSPTFHFMLRHLNQSCKNVAAIFVLFNEENLGSLNTSKTALVPSSLLALSSSFKQKPFDSRTRPVKGECVPLQETTARHNEIYRILILTLNGCATQVQLKKRKCLTFICAVLLLRSCLMRVQLTVRRYQGSF